MWFRPVVFTGRLYPATVPRGQSTGVVPPGGGLGVCLCVSVWEYLSIKKKEKKRFQYLRIMCPGAGVINHSNEPLQACFCHDPFQPHLLPRASGKLYLLTEKVILAAQISQLECAVLMPLGFL